MRVLLLRKILAEVNLDTTGPKVDLENRISEYFENKTYSSVEGEPVVATVAFPSSASSLSESSDVCKCYAVVDELRLNVMELRCKVDSIHIPAETSKISLLRERNNSLEKSIEELKSEKNALLVALRLVSSVSEPWFPVGLCLWHTMQLLSRISVWGDCAKGLADRLQKL